jgi:hypothetical protein
MATTVINPKKPKVGVTQPPPVFDFSKDALLPSSNPSGKTAAEMSMQAEQQMKDRVIAQSMSKPNETVVGGQMGSLPTGTGTTPVTFQARTTVNPTVESVRPPQGTAYNPADKSIRDPLTGNIMTQSEGGFRFVRPEDMPKPGATEGEPGFGTGEDLLTKFSSSIKGGGSETDKQIQDLYGKLNTGQNIDDELAREEERIRSEADTALRDANLEYENRNAEEFSALAGIGSGVNPLSSGASSVANRNKGVYEKMKSNVLAQRDARLSSARAAAAGQKTDAIQGQIARLEKERAQQREDATFEYNMRRQALQDSQDVLERTARAAKENRDLSAAERDDARANIKNMFDMLGSKAFEGVAEEDLRDLEKAAGLPAGTVRAGVQTIKEQELAAKNKEEANEYKFVSATKYQPAGYFNARTGDFVPVEGLKTAGPPSSGGSGGGGGTATSSFKTETNRARAELAAGRTNWGSAFGRIKSMFPGMTDAQIDASLGTEWRDEGAYEKFAGKQQGFRGSTDPLDAILNDLGGDEEEAPAVNTSSEDQEDELDAIINDIRSGL